MGVRAKSLCCFCLYLRVLHSANHIATASEGVLKLSEQCSAAKGWVLQFTADTDARQGSSRGLNKQMLPQEHHLAAKVSVRKAKKLTTGAGQETAGVPALSQPGAAWLSHPIAVLYSLQTSANAEADGKLAEQPALQAHRTATFSQLDPQDSPLLRMVLAVMIGSLAGSVMTAVPGSVA